MTLDFDIRKMSEKEGILEEELQKAIKETNERCGKIFLEPKRVKQIIILLEKNKEKASRATGEELAELEITERKFVSKIKNSLRKTVEAKKLYGALILEETREKIFLIWKEMTRSSLVGATSIYSAKEIFEDAPLSTIESKMAMSNWEKYADKEIGSAETLHDLRRILKLCPQTRRNKCIRKMAEFYKDRD